MPLRTLSLLLIGSSCLLPVLSRPCSAHFLWLAANRQATGPQALAFFGESPADRTYHLPDSLRELIVHVCHDGKCQPIPTEHVESEILIGLRSVAPVAVGATFLAQSCYGVYHGTLLHYYAKYLPAEAAQPTAQQPNDSSLRLEIVPVLTEPESSEKGALAVRVLWENKPLPEASVSLMQPDRPVEKSTTDATGTVRWKQVESGLIGILASRVDERARGEWQGTAYTSETHFASLTLELAHGHPPDAATTASEQEEARDRHRPSLDFPDAAEGEADTPPSGFPALPESISSFGAAVSHGVLYVYGGHTGTEHHHSRDNLSSHFVRLNLESGSNWEKLPMETPLQGLALVAHGKYIYRIGGMTARNAAGEDDDLHSVDEFARFDPQCGSWQALPSLPTGRSSHDAVVLGDQLYLVGGWCLSGDDDGEWASNALVFDLRSPSGSWQPIPQPFLRRALAVGQLAGQVVAIGGIDEAGNVSRDVNLFNPSSRSWSAGPSLPGEGMNGFGVSAWNYDGALYVSGSNGTVYRLDAPTESWSAVAQLQQSRFFHRLLPGPTDSLLAVAGASRSGHLAGVERIELETNPKPME